MGKRIDWTTFEQSQVFTATHDLLKQRKVALPVQSELGLKLFMQAMRDAQVALPENRRRPLASIEAVGGDLRQRFIDTGTLPKDPERYKRGAAKREQQPAAIIDPRDERMKELEERCASLQEELRNREDLLQLADERIRELEARPDAMTVVRQWVSKTLADALIMADDAKKPHAVRIDELRDGAQRPPKHNPEMEPTGRLWRPKVAIVGGDARDHQAVQREIGDDAEMRYFNPDIADSKRMQGLVQFASSGGSVILWLDHTRHQNRAALGYLRVEHHIHNGNLASLIDRVKGFMQTQRAKHAATTQPQQGDNK